LLGHHREGTLAPAEQVWLTYEWLVESPPPSQRYHFFNHLVDDAGQLVAQEDAAAINALYWQTGDRLVTQFHLTLPADLPAGNYRLLVGMYSWPDLVRVPLATGGDVYETAVWQVGE
jgi:hypothetical protein